MSHKSNRTEDEMNLLKVQLGPVQDFIAAARKPGA